MFSLSSLYILSQFSLHSLSVLPGQLYQGVTEEAGQQFDYALLEWIAQRFSFLSTCPQSISIVLSVMNTNITLNKEQQQVIDLLNKTCEKVKLLDHNGLALCRCLIKDQKVIDIYLTENEAIASYNDATDLQSSEDSYTFDYINEDVLAKLFSRVANADQFINTLHNKQYVEELQEFLK